MKYRANAVFLVIIIMSALILFTFSLSSKIVKEKRVSEVSLKYINSLIEMKSYAKIEDLKLEKSIKNEFFNYLKDIQDLQLKNKIVILPEEEISNINKFNNRINNPFLNSQLNPLENDYRLSFSKLKKDVDGTTNFLLTIQNKENNFLASILYQIKNPDFSNDDFDKIYRVDFETLWTIRKDEIINRKFSYE